MKKFVLATALVGAAFSATAGLAADLKMATKAPAVAVVATPWDIAFGAALMSDYIFRGVTQSAHKPSVAAYFEPRYNLNKDVQLYVGVAGESIDFPNRAAAEIDVYGGIRPTFGKLAFDFGVWGYLYPGGQCFNTPALCTAFGGGNFVAFILPNGNVIKRELSFWEVYGKATYTFTDEFAAGVSVNYSPSVLNSGAEGTFVAGNAKYTFPGTVLPNGIGLYVSADVGHWFLGTTDPFYGFLPPFPNGIPYKSYTTWDLGFGLTWKKFTLDFRYYDTDLNKGDCNAFTSDHTATATGFITPINPAPGIGSNWCSATFVVKGSVDLAVSDLK